MTIRTDINFHLLQMSEALVKAHQAFDGSNTYQQALTDLGVNVMKQLDALNGVLTGQDYLAAYPESIADDIKVSFFVNEDDDLPVSRRAPYGISYDHSRGA